MEQNNLHDFQLTTRYVHNRLTKNFSAEYSAEILDQKMRQEILSRTPEQIRALSIKGRGFLMASLIRFGYKYRDFFKSLPILGHLLLKRKQKMVEAAVVQELKSGL